MIMKSTAFLQKKWSESRKIMQDCGPAYYSKRNIYIAFAGADLHGDDVVIGCARQY